MKLEHFLSIVKLMKDDTAKHNVFKVHGRSIDLCKNFTSSTMSYGKDYSYTDINEKLDMLEKWKDKVVASKKYEEF